MKTKLLIIVMAVVLFVNSYDLRVFASTDYDHDRLLEYDGYAEAMYESIVEQTTFISGRYTENKDYVNESINQITDYAKGWWNEYERISNMPPKEKIREMINAGGGYLLTVGDFIKNLFTDHDESIPPDNPDYSGYEVAFSMSPTNKFNMLINSGWTGYFIKKDGTKSKIEPKTSISIYSGANETSKYYYFALTHGSYTVATGDRIYLENGKDVWAKKDEVYANAQSVSGIINYIYRIGVGFELYKDGKIYNVGSSQPRPSRDLNTYINNNSPQIVTPKPTAYLSCPDGTRINMKINGGTFLDVKGNIMQVDKNGTATVDSQICNLGWEKPKVQYIDDKIGVSTPNGDVIDAETGETITGGGDSEFDDEIQDGCGTLCALGKLLSGLGSIAKAIAAIPLKILDGLLELVKKILIPEENFWTTNLDGLKNKFFHDELKEVQNGVESLESVGGGQFGDVTGSLMGVDNLTIIDSSSINMSLEKIHSWVRGFFYPLLLFFNINQMYRVIRGTSLIGIGGKKEE